MRVSHRVRRKNDSDSLRHHHVNVETRGWQNSFYNRWATEYLSTRDIVVAPSPSQKMHFPARSYTERVITKY